MIFIKEIPSDERPRERLKKRGVEALSNVELVAILIGTGTKEKSVLKLAEELVYHMDSINYLNKMGIAELCQIKGIKQAKATTILAAIELGRRMHVDQVEKRKIKQALDVYHLYEYIGEFEQEHFFVIYLDTKGNIIKKELVFIGSINQTVIHPREIFKHAVRVSAHALIFVHNHPTGDANPSHADIKATEELVRIGEFMRIDVIDHIIIGKKQYYSIKEQILYRI